MAVSYHTDGRVARIILDLSATGGALDAAGAIALERAGELTAGSLAVVLAGPPGSFCIGEMAQVGGATFPDAIDSPGARAVRAIAALPVPTIAAIDGPAWSLGLELALACDLRVASPAASFALPALAEGVLPYAGATQRLPRLVGRAAALDLLLLGDTIDAAEARRIGLVTRITPSGQAETLALELARRIAQKAPVAVRYLREAVLHGLDLTLDQGLGLEADLYFLIQTTADRMEGIRSFLEKRTPTFTGG
jgi:enoyl-CoA hydratase/carnithine racemase